MHQIGNKTVDTKRKVLPVDDLAKVLAEYKSQGKKVALCHGVFDLLHIGHIRYFEQARKDADVLVVTLTADRYVNRGPHRPAFTQNLRAEAVAALDCVNYVAISDWPMATEVISRLKPDFYVKGSDYKDAEKDVTGGIEIEKAAIESVGGKIIFTDDIVFSSSALINRHMSLMTDEAKEFLSDFGSRYNSDEIIKYLDSAKKLKVLAIGETIIDEYQYCEAIGKSSKEPMLAVKRLNSEKFAGGILAVGNHLTNFAGTVQIVTSLGGSETQEEFIREHLNPKVQADFLYRKDSPTIVKKRFIDQYSFSKLLEVYTINDQAFDKQDEGSLCTELERLVPQFDVVVVVDFGHGLMGDAAIAVVRERARYLAVNTQCNAGNLGYQTISKYSKADFVSMTELEIRIEMRNRRGDLKELIKDLANTHDYGRVVVTRGKRGCLCYSKEEGLFEVPAFAGQVVDRMGAGDAFLALTSLCAVQNAPLEVLGFIGNAVGAQAVATVGHRTSIERVPLVKAIHSLLK